MIAVSKSLIVNSVILWIIVFPFIYGLLISRLFGLKKKLDWWIVVLLHISASSVGAILCFLLFLVVNNLVLFLVSLFCILVGVEGLIWQLFLKDRKLNGFIVSLICNSIFYFPIIIAALHLFMLG